MPTSCVVGRSNASCRHSGFCRTTETRCLVSRQLTTGKKSDAGDTTGCVQDSVVRQNPL